MKSFEYHAPRSVPEALSLLQRYGGNAKILAGGLSLIPLIRLGFAEPECVIDLKKVAGLSYIKVEGNVIRVGALSKHVEIATSPVVRQNCAILSEAARAIGHPQIRNKGTIGGSLSHADPAADYPAVILALDAQMKITSLQGERVVEADQFFKGVFETAVQEGEILSEISVPTLKDGTGAAYMKLCLTPGDFPILGIAAILSLDANGRCARAKLAIGGVADTPIRLVGAEQALINNEITDELVKKVGELVSGAFKPADDVRASGWYKVQMAKVYTERVLRKAIQRAGPKG